MLSPNVYMMFMHYQIMMKRVIYISLQDSFMTYVFIISHCIRVETETIQEELEVEIVTDPVVEQPTFEHQGRHHFLNLP